MGTRSLIAFEKPKKKYHVQYMQFDGGPSCKGLEYYTGVLEGVIEGGTAFLTKTGKPNKLFFNRIHNFLNNYMYASGHSINNNFTIDASEWKKQDCCQEWQYLFNKDGDFIFFSSYRDSTSVIIPWELTKALMTGFHGSLEFVQPVTTSVEGRLHVSQVSVFANYFDIITRWLTDYNHEDEETRIPVVMPVLSLEYSEVLAFPSQGDGGWRESVRLLLRHGDRVEPLLESMFVQHDGERRNERVIKSGII